jgi:uncharacterized oxidoreductase
VPNIRPELLSAFAEQIFMKLGASKDAAKQTAALMLLADLQGYWNHGIASLLPDYVQRAQSGIIRPDATPEIVREGKATAQIDGHLAFGQVVGSRAISVAIEKARVHGLGAVGARNCSHFGRIASYVEQAADAGMVGMAYVTVGGGSIASLGSAVPTGNSNPIAYAFPGRDGDDVVFDFTTASMSMREVARRGTTGEPIPSGIMLDGAGNPTTDYAAFSGPPRGAVLPFGGHKGSGLHLVAEILAGVLTGHGTALTWAPRGGPAINGGLFVALDVAEFMPLERFQEELATLAEFLRSRKPAAGVDAIRLPGEGARMRAVQRASAGIPVDDATLATLGKLAQDLHAPPLGLA